MPVQGSGSAGSAAGPAGPFLCRAGWLAAGRRAGVCDGAGVEEDLWDAYDRMGMSFARHAADSAYNAPKD